MVDLKTAERLIAALDDDLKPEARLGKVARYLEGTQDLPYCPKSVGTEYRTLARKAITNWLPLISDTFSKSLFVDGYRPARETDNAAAWASWQANGLDARQSVTHRGALEYGTAYVLVLPGTDGKAVIRTLSPLRSYAWYADEDDDFPTLGLRHRGTDLDGRTVYDVIDATEVTTVARGKDDAGLRVIGTPQAHGLGVCPMVRFRDRLDGAARGIIAPLINVQDRINEAVFALMIAIQYASFRQRWAVGLELDTDDEPYLADGVTANPNHGKPIPPFKSGIDRLWVSDSPDTKFGDFAQTMVDGHLASYDSAVRTLAAIAQTPPHVLLGDLVNLSADALAAAEAGTQRKGGEYESLFGESWEQVFLLAARASGDVTDPDTSAQVRWRDTEARALASTVDALGKMAQMLSVPAEALWERIPGVTDQDIERWRELAGKADGLAAIAEALTRQQAPATPAPPAAPALPDGD